ncbi:hypothetical protein [Flexibacterium corallicola]|uniref:hypothetical protein n=1 Tax=Flexibacterium corallicola TaxID=3037259 RepID=UPI00286EF9D6|nr:hypothetical protein [Pseudovibrio sp. M1P-2-3]
MADYSNEIPNELNLDALRREKHNPWMRNEICYNADKTKFVAAFDILEISMCNEMGPVVWGSISDGKYTIEGYINNYIVFCHQPRFAFWKTQNSFFIRIGSKKLCQTPSQLLIDFSRGIQLLVSSSKPKVKTQDIEHFTIGSDFMNTRQQLMVALGINDLDTKLAFPIN